MSALEDFVRENGGFLVNSILIRAQRLEDNTTRGLGVGSERAYFQNLDAVEEYRAKAVRLQELLSEARSP